ncbi:MBL fold metallo-hydrolase [Algoriphagus machipongonensis]|uniref:Outer membrane protein RomA n=1 Tax=Algoriphagus machipongonensis TaxID=388413 RepID=A3HSY9_9BACT|nr:MBL fold metallo-hydrolase [Algoriphagus machipongonensis]EAZ82957.1 outer membrane protein RomA [Algoriphagus machipongonensis]
MRKQFGGKITKSDIEKYKEIENWDGEKFLNLEPTSMDFSFQALPKFLYKQFCEKEGRESKKPIPVIGFDKKEFLKPSEKAKFIWYGHSAILLRLNNKTILIDPMLGPNASPIAPFSTKRFSQDTLSLIDEFPEIDLLLMTHDHYDHLDLDSILKLKGKVKQYYVGMGVARHLVKWGIDSDLITEFNWWKSEDLNNIQITYTPTRHFSGRGLTDRAKSMWGGWAFKTNNENIWFSGDGGYGEHFEEVGKRLGPFDFAWMECGQYNENWRLIHLFPDESVQAAMDGQAKQIMPVHWAGFSLAQHSWTEPVEKFIESAERREIDYITPMIGELITLDRPRENKAWWKNH